jgi:hypothetical protein
MKAPLSFSRMAFLDASDLAMTRATKSSLRFHSPNASAETEERGPRFFFLAMISWRSST